MIVQQEHPFCIVFIWNLKPYLYCLLYFEGTEIRKHDEGDDGEGGDSDGSDDDNNGAHKEDFEYRDDRPIQPEGSSVFSGIRRKNKANKQPTQGQNSTITDILAFYLATEQIPLTFLKCGMIPDVLHACGIKFNNPCESTVSNEIAKQYGNARADLHEIFKRQVLKGCVTYDGWTRNQKKFTGVTFHYLDEEFECHSVVIGFEEYTFPSTAENITKQVGKYRECCLFDSGKIRHTEITHFI